MLDYFYRCCQSNLKIVLVIILTLTSCSEVSYENVEAVPNWFKVDEKYTFKDHEGNYLNHPFYDLTPFESTDKIELNFFVTTPIYSKYDYNFDIVSGRRYMSRPLCKQEDVWNLSSKKIYKPNFTEGVVPRVMDQLGHPQKIIVFGRNSFYKNFDANLSVSHRVRVVGGYVEQYCSNYPCSADRTWKSRMVLVAVDPQDVDVSSVKTMVDLKGTVDWEYAKNYLQNYDGRRFINEEKVFPSYRIIGETDARVALTYALTKGHYFTIKELHSLRDNCFKLYDYIWDNYKSIEYYKEQDLARKSNEYKAAQALEGSNVFNLDDKGNIITENKIALPEVSTKYETTDSSFPRFLERVHRDYGGKFYTCSRFVRPANVVQNSKRQWLFAYISLLFKMEQLGYRLICNSSNWVNVAAPEENRRHKKSPVALDNCTDRDLGRGLEVATRLMNVRRRNQQEHFRFVSYDSGVGGSHQKIYSWVYSRGKRLMCTSDSTQEDIDKAFNSQSIFPEDVEWNELFVPGRQLKYTF